MDKLLRLYTYVDGVNDTPFPNSDNPIEIGEFRYDAKRMGGAPTIAASVYYPSCLDDVWTDNVYAKFNGEKYYLKQTPTSSYNNESTMYKHDLELVSERVILDNVYFFDTVVGDPQGDDKPISNSTKVVFFGNIHEFVKRLNSSLEYAKLLKWEDVVDENSNEIKIPKGYYVVVDNNANITTEEKLMSFEDQFFSNVLQEIYNTYEVPYYFEGKTIHIGYSNSNAVVPTFSYGVDDALLSITKNNANYKIVNRATATGSSDNIPFYYPNNSPKGDIAANPSGNFEVKILDTELYSNEIKLDGVIRKSNVEYENAKVGFGGKDNYDGETLSAAMGKGGIDKKCVIEFISKEAGIFLLSFSSSVTKYILEEEEKSDATFRIRYFIEVYDRTANKFTYDSNGNLSSIEDFEVLVPHANHKYEIFIKCYYAVEGKYAGKGGRIEYNATYSFGSKSGWMYEDKVVDLKDVGLEVVGDTVVGDTITQTLVKYIKTSQNLMPSIYRETDGEERFYNATNGTYEGVSFNNPYVEGRPKEHIFTVEDIKPTIEGTEVNGLRIDMFSEFAYDDDDNDETYEDEEGNVYFKHPYFYGKLRVMDFNLFDHAIEQQPMTISFTSGHCGACNFEIGVTEEYPQKNPVQVDEYGNLVRDENGMVLAGVEGTQQDVTTFQERQQDTSKYEVWIALRKEEDTYGILMPKAPKFNEAGEQIEAGHRPKACTEGQNDGDTFVIIGINLPQSYIINAEKKLEAEIIKYLQDNNDEKFTFSIEFSRIYFEENDILDQLSENSKIAIMYNGQRYDLYVSSFSYSMSEGDVLPEIRVELDETLKVSQNALQNAISQVKSELGRAMGSIDVVGAATPYFIRKDADDEAQGRINFKKGIKFGEGGKVEIMPDNGAKLTIDYLEVSKKATFNSLEIAEKKHVGGQILLTPAAMKCGEVEEFDDYYRCYFQTKSEGGDEIFNQFAVNDQAICQTFNAWGSRYYWRLVVGVGEDYIDLSKTDCDEYSDIPSVGDSIILLGNRTDITRQAAIVLSAYDDDAPSLIMYNGINSYSLVEKNITGIIWNPETKEPQMYSYGSFFFGDRQLNKNFITFQKKEGDTDKNLYINGKLTIGAGSEGLSNLSEWSDKQTQINNAQASADNAKSAADNAQTTANDAKAKAEDAQTRAGLLESTTSNLSKKITDVENNITETVEDINKRLDGVVENYFEEGVPTLSNYPANQWTTDNEKKNHIGDTYTNINTYETDPENAGKSWRWVNTDSEHSGYHWHPIADSDAVKALQDAAKAQSTADGKSTTFLRQPTNYKEGDLWILQSDSDHTAGKKGEILTANTSSTNYNASHWSKEVIYTDDKALEEFLDGAYKETMNNLKEQIQSTSQILAGMNNDTVLDSTEKSYIRTLWENINGIPSLVTVGSTGSYISTLKMVEKAGYNSGQDVLLTFNGKTLVFNGKKLEFNHLGIEDFKVTYLNLRQYLADMRLYDNCMSEGYDRQKMSSLFTAYYDAQEKLLENAQYYYADMSAKDTLNQFIQGDYADEIAGLKASLDEKAETYVQKTDPAASWTTDEVKAKHVSDIWWNSSENEVSGVAAGATAIYRYDGTKYYWEQSPVPKAIFDEIDGKNSIYVSKPKNYKARDMWIMEEGLTAGDVPADCVPGDILIATATSETYSAAHWKKFVRYTDDSALQTFITGEYADTVKTLRSQIDGKAMSFVQSSDPASEWLTTEVKKAHVGDMWLNTSSTAISGIGSMKTAIYQLVDNAYKWVQKNIPNELFDKIDGKAQIFVTTPTSYHENDMWIIGNDISSSDMPSGASVGELMVSTKDSGSYNKSHWVKMVKYTDDTAVNNFISGEFATYKTNIQNQIDKKAQTWYQSTDPSTQWTTDSAKNEHIGDMWLNTSSNTVAGVEAGMTAMWNGSAWKPSKVPQDVFDKIDGKSSLYVIKPTSYHERDMWIIESGATNLPAGCTVGDLVVAIQNSDTYSPLHWTKKVKYTDDTALQNFINNEYADDIDELQGQIDKKAETWAQATDPAANWSAAEKAEHINDIWWNKSTSTISGVKAGECAIYKLVSGTYQWVVTPVPEEVFDEIDGKAALYIAKPVNGYRERDMWIIEQSATNLPAGATIGDLVVATRNNTQYIAGDWQKNVKYTDDKALEEFLEGAYKETVTNLQEQIQSTTEAINKMNSDHVLDEAEKSYIRTEWEQINGYPCFDKIGSTGSYQTTLDIIAASGYTVGEAVTLTFNGKKLTFNGKSIAFNYRGMDSFRAAYYNLRDFLDEIELYNVGSTDGFDREKLARLFSAYYDAQAILIDNSQKYYASKKAEDAASSYKDDMAKKLGYSSYADMETQVKENGSIIMEGGYLNAQLIAAKAITSAMIAVEELFSQHIEANDMNLKTGCVIGDLSIGKYVSACGKADLVDSVYSKYTSVEQDVTYTHGTRLSSGGIEVTGEGMTDMYCLISNRFLVNASRSPLMNEKPIVEILANSRPALKVTGKSVFYTSVDGDNIVIEIDNGMVSGLRPMSKNITAKEYYLTEYDHTLFCTNSRTDLYLPEFPLVGQEYVILVPNGGVGVYGNGKKICLFHDGIDRESYTCGDLGSRTEQRLYWNKADNKWWATYIRH